MLPYLVYGGSIAIIATVVGQRNLSRIAWASLAVALILFIGLRHNVGMDWNNYLRMIAKINWVEDLEDLLLVAEPGYAALLWFGAQSGWGIYLTNLITTTIFVVGLFRMASRMPEPWLAIMASLPVLTTAIAMSANRQAAACGIIFWLVSDWDKFRTASRIAFILAASTFHLSALVMLAFVGFATTWHSWAKVAISILLFSVAGYALIITGRAEYYDDAYLRGQTSLTQSSGAFIHVSMTALPALAVLFVRRIRVKLLPNDLYRQMALISVATLLLVPFASAASGRLSLYWYPAALMVWSSLPSLAPPKDRLLIRYGIAILMFVLMLVWLTFANSAFAYFPYRNALLMPEWELEIGYVP